MGKVVSFNVGIDSFNAPYEPIRQILASLPCKDTVQICIAVHRTMTRLLSMDNDTDAVYFADSEKLANAIGACYVYSVQGVPIERSANNDSNARSRNVRECSTSKGAKM